MANKLSLSVRLINFNMQYEGEYYKSFVAGRDKRITAIGHVVDCDVAFGRTVD